MRMTKICASCLNECGGFGHQNPEGEVICLSCFKKVLNDKKKAHNAEKEKNNTLFVKMARRVNALREKSKYDKRYTRIYQDSEGNSIYTDGFILLSEVETSEGVVAHIDAERLEKVPDTCDFSIDQFVEKLKYNEGKTFVEISDEFLKCLGPFDTKKTTRTLVCFSTKGAFVREMQNASVVSFNYKGAFLEESDVEYLFVEGAYLKMFRPSRIEFIKYEGEYRLYFMYGCRYKNAENVKIIMACPQKLEDEVIQEKFPVLLETAIE